MVSQAMIRRALAAFAMTVAALVAFATPTPARAQAGGTNACVSVQVPRVTEHGGPGAATPATSGDDTYHLTAGKAVTVVFDCGRGLPVRASCTNARVQASRHQWRTLPDALVVLAYPQGDGEVTCRAGGQEITFSVTLERSLGEQFASRTEFENLKSEVDVFSTAFIIGAAFDYYVDMSKTFGGHIEAAWKPRGRTEAGVSFEWAVVKAGYSVGHLTVKEAGFELLDKNIRQRNYTFSTNPRMVLALHRNFEIALGGGAGLKSSTHDNTVVGQDANGVVTSVDASTLTSAMFEAEALIRAYVFDHVIIGGGVSAQVAQMPTYGGAGAETEWRMVVPISVVYLGTNW